MGETKGDSMRKHLVLFMVLVGCLMLQGQDRPFGPTRLALPGATTLPTTCAANIEVYIDTDATPAGQQVFLCNSSGNGFNLIGDGTGGDSISVNSSAVVDADFDDATPAQPTDGMNVDWQTSGSGPADISANLKVWDLCDPRRLVCKNEEFLGGVESGNGSVGELGWGHNNAFTRQQVAGRPGVLRSPTSSTINTHQHALFGASNGNAGPMNSQTWRQKWGFRLNTDTEMTARAGLMNEVTVTTPSDGIYFQYNVTVAAGNWFVCSRAASTETCTDTTTAVDANFHDFEIRNNGSNSISFFIDGTETTGSPITTNIPTVNLSFGATIENLEAADKTMDLDYFTFKMLVSR